MENSTVQVIPFAQLALAFIPACIVVGLLHRWLQGGRNGLYAIVRMLVQLLLVGYFLEYIFGSKSVWSVFAVLIVMISASSWIALRTIKEQRLLLYTRVFSSIMLGGGATLFLITQGVLDLHPWYQPNYCIPLAGMIFANAMNSVSLAADRLAAEVARELPYEQARNIAFRASLIPITNSLFAVGLVSLPGMMTGQILSGVSPLVAARYQVMVMCMVFGAAGISSASFLVMSKQFFQQEGTRKKDSANRKSGRARSGS